MASAKQPTESKSTMATINKDNPEISIAEMIALREESLKQTAAWDEAIASKRVGVIEALAKEYSEKTSAAGISIQAAIDALAKYKPVTVAKKGAASGSKVKKSDMPQPLPGAIYKNPATGETWTKKLEGTGWRCNWARTLVKSGTPWESFQVK